MQRFTFLLLYISSACALPASEVYWPGWLGPNRDGQVDYFEVPEEWPKSVKREWSLVVGEGSGMPIVAEGRVYQHARLSGEEVVWCLDLESGEVLWRKSYPVNYRIQHFGTRHGNGPLSNPTWADGRLFTLSVTNVFSAWDADSGELLWRKDYSDQFRNAYPDWGASTSPLVDGEQVIIHFGGARGGVLAAFDVATGKELWTEGNDGACHASPILVELNGVRQIVEWNHDAVVGIESQTGKRLWDYDLPHRGSSQNSPTPIHFQGRILIGGENRGIRSLEPKFENGKWIVEENWHQRGVSLNMASAMINGDSLYGKSHLKRGQFFRLDPKTGEPIWLGPARMGEYATFLSIPGHVLVLKDDATLEVLKADAEDYERIAVYPVAESPTWAAPVLLRNGFLIKDLSKLFKWSFD
jgi:outer membrane protein assembly factor BamB